MIDVDGALRHLVESGGSDLHVKVPARPLMRLHGHLTPVPETDKVMPDDAIGVLEYVLRDHKDKLHDFMLGGECDFAYALPGVARFRVNAFRQRGSVSMVFRAIGFDIMDIDNLMLPQAIKTLAEEERGIVLVTGTTGSGKSTTLAAMIKYINDTTAKHVITLEDPIEFLHTDNKSIVQQREVGEDTESFERALRRILRQDPDVILIGEMRDEETVATALSAAETGHLVFSTLHTLDATETINRIIDFFPLHQNRQVRAILAGTLRGVISQRLVRTVNGTGRVPICEVMIATNRVKDMIMDPDQTSRIEEAITEGEYYGMQTFDQALFKHLRNGRITMEDALKAATSPHDFKLLVAAEGEGTGGIEKIMEAAKVDTAAKDPQVRRRTGGPRSGAAAPAQQRRQAPGARPHGPNGGAPAAATQPARAEQPSGQPRQAGAEASRHVATPAVNGASPAGSRDAVAQANGNGVAPH